MTNFVLGIFLVFHIGAVVVWMGSALLTSSVLSPSISRISAGARKEIVLRMVPKLVRYMLASAVITISAGILTLAYLGSMDQSMFPTQWSLFSLLIGTFLGFSAAMATFASMQPWSNRLSRFLGEATDPINKSEEASLEIEKATNALKNGARIISVMLILVFVLMVIGANP